MSPLEQDAMRFAFVSHSGKNQLRKYTGDPYIVHPAAVASIVRTVEHTDEMLAAAWLHDVVEDCGVDIREIKDLFGTQVAYLVMWLTDKSRPEDGNRAQRKAIDRNALADAPNEAKTIKLADLIDNSKTILQHDPKFAKTYMEEKRLLLDVLVGGDSRLYNIAQGIVRNYLAGRVYWSKFAGKLAESAVR